MSSQLVEENEQLRRQLDSELENSKTLRAYEENSKILAKKNSDLDQKLTFEIEAKELAEKDVITLQAKYGVLQASLSSIQVRTEFD